FMGTTREVLVTANPRLVPLVAHDRASFGGMLIASGIALLLPSLWGFRQGQRWLWWAFLLAALPAYAAGIGVHFAVGYTNPGPRRSRGRRCSWSRCCWRGRICSKPGNRACKSAVWAGPASRSRKSAWAP